VVLTEIHLLQQAPLLVGCRYLIGGTRDRAPLRLGGCNFIGGGLVNNIRAGADFDTISGVRIT